MKKKISVLFIVAILVSLCCKSVLAEIYRFESEYFGNSYEIEIEIENSFYYAVEASVFGITDDNQLATRFHFKKSDNSSTLYYFACFFPLDLDYTKEYKYKQSGTVDHEDILFNFTYQIFREAKSISSVMPDGFGTGNLFPGSLNLSNLPSVKVPTLILPRGPYIPTDIMVKYDGKLHDNKKSIKYDVRLVDSEGNNVELPGECLLIFPYPDGLNMNSGRKYRITIHHYGKKETQVFSTEKDTIQLLPQGLCICVSSFSPFVIEWEERSESDLPQTGDNSHIILWFALLTLAGTATLILKRKTA